MGSREKLFHAITGLSGGSTIANEETSLAGSPGTRGHPSPIGGARDLDQDEDMQQYDTGGGGRSYHRHTSDSEDVIERRNSRHDGRQLKQQQQQQRQQRSSRRRRSLRGSRRNSAMHTSAAGNQEHDHYMRALGPLREQHGNDYHDEDASFRIQDAPHHHGTNTATSPKHHHHSDTRRGMSTSHSHGFGVASPRAVEVGGGSSSVGDSSGHIGTDPAEAQLTIEFMQQLPSLMRAGDISRVVDAAYGFVPATVINLFAVTTDPNAHHTAAPPIGSMDPSNNMGSPTAVAAVARGDYTTPRGSRVGHLQPHSPSGIARGGGGNNNSGAPSPRMSLSTRGGRSPSRSSATGSHAGGAGLWLECTVSRNPHLLGTVINAHTGIIGYVCQTGRTVNLARAREDWRFDRHCDVRPGIDTQSMIVMPVQNPAGATIAILEALNCVSTPHPNRASAPTATEAQQQEGFLDAHMNFMRVLSGVCSLMLGSKDAAKVISRQERQLNAMHQILGELTSCVAQDSLEDVVRNITRAAYLVVPAECVSVFLVDETSGELVRATADTNIDGWHRGNDRTVRDAHAAEASAFAASSSPTSSDAASPRSRHEPKQQQPFSANSQNRDGKESRKPGRMRMSMGIAGYAASRGQVVNISSVSTDWRFDARADQTAGIKARCILAVPIFNYVGRTRAVIHVVNKVLADHRPGIFDENDERMLLSLAATATSMFRQAQLSDDVFHLQESSRAQHIINEIVQLDMSTSHVVPRIIAASYQLVNAERISLFMIETASRNGDMGQSAIDSNGTCSSIRGVHGRAGSIVTPLGTLMESPASKQQKFRRKRSSILVNPRGHVKRGSLSGVDSDTEIGEQYFVCKVSRRDSLLGMRLPWGHGIIGHVATTMKSVNIPDAYESKYFNRDLDEKTGFVTRSVLTVPILESRGAVVGVIQAINKIPSGLDVDSRGSPNTGIGTKCAPFSKEDVANLESLAATAGSVLRKARLYEAALKAERKVRALLKVLHHVGDRNASMNVIVDSIIGVAREALNADRVTLFFKNETGVFSTFVAEDGRSGDVVKQTGRQEVYRLGDSIPGRVAQTGECVNLADVSTDLRFSGNAVTSDGYHMHSVLCVPVVDVDHEVLAVICACNKHHSAGEGESEGNAGVSWETDAGRESEDAAAADSKKGDLASASDTSADESSGIAEAWNSSGLNSVNRKPAGLRRMSSLKMRKHQAKVAAAAHSISPSSPLVRLKGPLSPVGEDDVDGSALGDVRVAKRKRYAHFTHDDEQLLRALCNQIRAITRSCAMEALLTGGGQMIERTGKTNDSLQKRQYPQSFPQSPASPAAVGFVRGVGEGAPSSRRNRIVESFVDLFSKNSKRTYTRAKLQLIREESAAHYDLTSFKWAKGSVHDLKAVDGRETNLQNLDFNVFQWSDDDLIVFTVTLFQDMGLVDTFQIELSKLKTFVVCVRKNYNDHPFHNWKHAFSAFHFAYLCIRLTSVSSVLRPLDLLALLVASLCHDVDHPGRTNTFEVASNSDRALTHNDIHVLENHHARTCFQLLRRPECNIFSNLRADTMRELRTVMIQAILSTDLSMHFGEVTRLNAIKLTKDVAPADSVTVASVGGVSPKMSASKDGLAKSPERLPMDAVFNPADEASRQFAINIVIHSADLSGQVFDTVVAQVWEERISQEFKSQAAEEEKLGLPTADFMQGLDDPYNRAENQASFIDIVLYPWWKGVGKLFPELHQCVRNLEKNRDHYFRLSIRPEDANPSLSPPSSGK